MNDIHPGKGRDWTLSYTKANGDPGLIDPNIQAVVTVAPPDGATVAVGAFNTTTGQQVIAIDHNGNMGDVLVTVKNDGDLGSGIIVITISETFSMIGEGATAVSSSVSGERPTP